LYNKIYLDYLKPSDTFRPEFHQTLARFVDPQKSRSIFDNFSDPFSGDLIQGKSQLLFGRIIIYWDAMDV
jgi:hypothetical protein